MSLKNYLFFYCVKICLILRSNFYLCLIFCCAPYYFVCVWWACVWMDGVGGMVGLVDDCCLVLFFVANVVCRDVVCLIFFFFFAFLNSELNQLHCFPALKRRANERIRTALSNFFLLLSSWLEFLNCPNEASSSSFYFTVQIFHWVSQRVCVYVLVHVSFAWFSQFSVQCSRYRCANCCSDVWVAIASK